MNEPKIQNPEEIDLDSAPDSVLEFAARWLGDAHPMPIRKSSKLVVRKVAAQALKDVLARRRVSRVVQELEETAPVEALTDSPGGA